MPYLTYEEYIDLGFTEIDETEFEKLLPKASDVIDSVTSYFYQFKDINEDVIKFRRTQFKKAVSAQVEYFDELGGHTTESINSKNIQTFSAGRTSVSLGGKNQSSSNEQERSIVSSDAINYLRITGLLYRGVATKW